MRANHNRTAPIGFDSLLTLNADLTQSMKRGLVVESSREIVNTGCATSQCGNEGSAMRNGFIGRQGIERAAHR
jgi:hypothetical protein